MMSDKKINMIDPRATVDMVSDLLEMIAEDIEWDYRNIPCSKGCCSDWTNDCYYCEAKKEDGHKPDCELGDLIKEARAFIDVEEDLKWERENSKGPSDDID